MSGVKKIVPGMLLGLSLYAGEAHSARIADVIFGGSGCSGGEADIIEGFWGPVGFEFDSFSVESGPDISRRNNRAFCQMALEIDAPTGWQFSLRSVRVQGEVALDAGTTAQLDVTQYFSAGGADSSLTSTIEGATDRRFDQLFTWEADNRIWSPCGVQRALNLKVSLALRGRDGASEGSVSSVELYDQWGWRPDIRWRRCS